MYSGVESQRISVIVVVRNGERYLAQGIQSILAQTLLPSEIIVVDGQSEDNTAAIARSFAGIKYLRQPDHGLANGRNLGISAATGKYIAFLDHDDIWLPEKLKTQVEAMRSKPALRYTTTLMKYIFENETEQRFIQSNIENDSPLKGSTPSGIVVDRDLFDKVGLFNPDYQIGCDADWFVRTRDLEIPSFVVPKVLFFKRLHQSNLSRNGSLNKAEMFLIARASIARKQRLQNDPHPTHHR